MRATDASIAAESETFVQALEQSDLLQARLVVAGYVLCGGSLDPMIIDAARSLQMLHCAATADDAHRPGAAIGLHAAEIVLANLDAPAELKIKALSITNRSLMLRAQAAVAQDQLAHSVLDLSATEAILNPIHVGMVLADADCATTDAITPYAMAVGRWYVSRDAQWRTKALAASDILHTWQPSEYSLLSSVFDDILRP